jgi:V/A-type H+-transporting ATPase subunit I
MSVQKMKVVTLTGPVDSFDEVVRHCIIDQEFHPESVLQARRGGRVQPFVTGNPAAPLLRQADELLARLSLEPRFCPLPEHMTLEKAKTTLDELEAHLNELDSHMAQLRQEAADSRSSVSELEKLSVLSVDLDLLRDLHHLIFRFGHLPLDSYNTYQEMLEQRDDCFFLLTQVEGDVVYGCCFAARQHEDAIDDLLSSMHFVTVPLSESIDGTAAQAIDTLTHQAEADETLIAGLQAEETALADESRSRLLALRAWLCRENQVLDMRRFAGRTNETFYIMGWVPAQEYPGFLAVTESFGSLDCKAEDADDAGLTPPTKLKNGLLGRIFEPFLRMYGLPNYQEHDPSAFMAITYCLFFGIMFGDVGQGVLLSLFGFFFMWKVKKMWLGRIVACCGVGSVIFGFVYGSVFGFEEWLPGFKILHGSNVVYLLLASLVLGALMILYVMVLNITNGIRQKDYGKIFFGPNGLAGMVFYLGLLVAAALALLGVVNLFRVWYVLPVLILPLLVIMLQEPLTHLVSGHKGEKEPIGGMLVGGFFELFEALLSFLTNTLSFLRVGAYAITHVALMLVVHALAGSGNVVVLVLGNLFVMALEAVLVCIQVLRLEFYEMFGRFYQDSGREYTPKIIDYTAKTN